MTQISVYDIEKLMTGVFRLKQQIHKLTHLDSKLASNVE